MDTEVVILLDASESIGQATFTKMLRYTQVLLRQLPIHFRVALIRYSTTVDIISGSLIDLSNSGKRENLLSILEGIEYVGGATATDVGIHQALLLFTLNEPCEKNGRKVILIMTDGKSNSFRSSVSAAENAKKRDSAHVYSLGVGRDIHEHELSMMASHPSEDYFYKIRNFGSDQDADLVISSLLDSICKGKFFKSSWVIIMWWTVPVFIFHLCLVRCISKCTRVHYVLISVSH